MAMEAGLDLVEVAPQARPPVCKILDYGKFKYEQKKKQSRSKTASSVLKEIRVRPKIDTHDLEIKIKKARAFLEEGHKVQVTCLFRGREFVYKEIGREKMLRVVEACSDIARIEREPRMEGRRMILLMSRKAGVPTKPKAGAPAPVDTAGTSRAPAEGEAAAASEERTGEARSAEEASGTGSPAAGDGQAAPEASSGGA